MLLAILNGAIRDFLYKNKLGELKAHQRSTYSLLVLMILFTYLMQLYFPLNSVNESVFIGICWFLFTEAFEFLFGRYIGKKTWKELFKAYNIKEGQLWVLIPICALIINLVIYILKN